MGLETTVQFENVRIRQGTEADLLRQLTLWREDSPHWDELPQALREILGPDVVKQEPQLRLHGQAIFSRRFEIEEFLMLTTRFVEPGGEVFVAQDGMEPEDERRYVADGERWTVWRPVWEWEQAGTLEAMWMEEAEE